MSNKDQYLKLWQQKRSELQVNTNPQTDWLDMHHLLDQQMPVVNNSASDTTAGSNLVKQLSHFAKFKLFYVAAALITAATITYVTTQHRAAKKDNKPAKTEVRADSVLNNNADTALIHEQSKDSTLSDGQPKDSADIKALAADTKADNSGVEDDVEDKSSTNPSIAKNNLNKRENSVEGRKAVISNINKSSRSRPGTNNSRLLSSANKTTNGLALTGNSVNNSSPSRGSHNIAGRQSGNVTAKAVNNRSRLQSANPQAINTINNGQIVSNTSNGIFIQNNISLSPLWSSAFTFNADAPLLVNNYATPGIVNANTALSNAANTRILKAPNAVTANLTNAAKTKNQVTKYSPAKSAGNKANTYSRLDWGILVGVNTQGSFTPKDQNKNIYGSLPVDAYAGLFATYNVSNKWAVDMQVKLLVPHNTGGNYNHAFATRNDTGQIVRQTYKITDSRKIYSAQMPLHLVYNITNNISVKAGPVINLPIKHFGASSLTASTDTVVDSIGYAGRLADTINRIAFKKRVSVGISGGISFNYKRLRLEAVYYRGSQPYTISSPLGSYSPAVNNIQISLGFKLNKTKPDK